MRRLLILIYLTNSLLLIIIKDIQTGTLPSPLSITFIVAKSLDAVNNNEF